jgi:inner membrane protein
MKGWSVAGGWWLVTDLSFYRPPTTDYQEFMMAKTHMLLAATVTSMVLETTHPIVLGTAALASQLPDVDTSTSLVGRLCWPLARWLESRFAHRTVTHSFLATGLVALLALPLWWRHPHVWYAVWLGYFAGWFGDAFTKAGVAAFYPLSGARLVIPAHPRLRLTTGSRAEYVVVALLFIALLGSLHLNSKGGLLRGVNVWLAQPEGVAALFARESTRHQILARIDGRLVASAQLIQEEFEVLEVEGEKLLVRDAQSQRFWAGHAQSCPPCHLDIHHVQARLGAPLVTETHELQWQEGELGAVIGNAGVAGGRWPVVGVEKADVGMRNPEQTDHRSPTTGHQLPATDHRPLATILFSGTLTLRDAESLRVPMSFQQFNPLEMVGPADEGTRVRTVRVRAATWQDLAPLQSHFGAGHLVVKLIRRKGDFANEPAE